MVVVVVVVVVLRVHSVGTGKNAGMSERDEADSITYEHDHSVIILAKSNQEKRKSL